MALLEKEMVEGSNGEYLGVPIMKDCATFKKARL